MSQAKSNIRRSICPSSINGLRELATGQLADKITDGFGRTNNNIM